MFGKPSSLTPNFSAKNIISYRLESRFQYLKEDIVQVPFIFKKGKAREKKNAFCHLDSKGFQNAYILG